MGRVEKGWEVKVSQGGRAVEGELYTHTFHRLPAAAWACFCF